MNYEIRAGQANGEILAIVDAIGVDEAAAIHARRTDGFANGGTPFAQRVTGEPGHSGCFQAYQSVPGGATSVGPQFHVREE